MINNKLKKNYSYPKPNDPDFQKKIFQKREFYYHKVPYREIMKSYDDIQKYREDNCAIFELREHQKIISNFINPNSPYKGLLLMHGTGTGKTGGAISIAEQFKEQVKKYNTKVYVLVPGPNTRENWKSELILTTGKTYLKNRELLNQLTKYEAEREKKMAVYGALQFYKIMSYKTFYKKVLGEKIKETKLDENNNIIKTYKKKENGEIERELVIDRIVNMDNSIIIVDEAHNLTKTEYGLALKTIIKKSNNLKIILLTATPMKNLADDIIDLLNFIRPQDDPIKREEVFTTETHIHQIQIKPNGLNIIKEKSKGYVSYYRGAIPYTFAKRIDKGTVPKGLLFTPVIQCLMEKFQYNTYSIAEKLAFNTGDKNTKTDSLFKAASASANFVFPGLDQKRKNLMGYYSTDGVTKVLSQLNTDKNKLFKIINKTIFKNKINTKDLENFMYENEKKGLSGLILNLKYLKYFSIKFYKCISRLNKLVYKEKGPGTAFVYSNLVKAGGMEIFAEALIENGYLEYLDNIKDYDIKDDTLDALTGKTFVKFKKEGIDLNTFYPATFILITGGVDDLGEDLPEIKQKIVREVFNSTENSKGKLLKIVLGSQVMNEGITLKNIKEIHILDVHFNLGRLEQVIGRGIRMCKHQDVITDDYKFPEVNVYRYVVSLKNKLSTDEILYKKAEIKFLLVKKIERALKESAIDCPLLLSKNKFPEEIKEFKNCYPPTLENIKKKKKICPSLCDFQNCDMKCNGDSLNKSYWDKNKKTYKDIKKTDIDYNTFNDELAKFEIDSIKNKIKDLYRFKHVYTYNELHDIIIKSFKNNQKDLFDKYFLDQALENLMPKTENEFNNFQDNINDKYNKSGYLIQRNKYYIFQPFDENEDVPYYYRQKMKISQDNLVPLSNFIKTNLGDIKENIENIEKKDDENISNEGYDFDSIIEYYTDRDENFIVGIIDKNNSKIESINKDLFKIREPRNKNVDKKRGTGIPTLKGAVCSTSKDKKYLIKILNKIPKNDIIDETNIKTRDKICNILKNKLLFLEKYSTSSDKNKITYIMIPSNHHTFKFPYNLEDRVKYNIKQINNIIERTVNIKVKKMKNGIFLNKRIEKLRKYEIEIKNNKYLNNNSKKINELGFKLINNKWSLTIE
jgi:hypothetical protein